MRSTVETIRGLIGAAGVSRREIAERGGLDIRTVSAGVRKLLHQGVVVARPGRGEGVGRPGTLYFQAGEDTLCFAGVYLDINEIIAVFKDIRGNTLDTSSEPFCLDWASLHHTSRKIRRIILDFERRRGLRVNAVGLTLRERRGEQFAAGMKRLLGVDVGLPIHVGTPIDAFAWAARARRPEARKVVVAHFGLVRIEVAALDGSARNAADERFARELSHLTVDKDGPPCYCGKNGCLEYYVHGFAMEEEFREVRGINPRERIDMSERHLAGDPVALDIVGKAERHIATALREMALKFKPDSLCLLVLEGDAILKRMAKVVDGSWKPDGGMDFQVCDVMASPGTACAEASAARAVLLSCGKNFLEQGRG